MMEYVNPRLIAPWLEALEVNARSALIPYFLNQRWFRSKEKVIKEIHVDDFLAIIDGNVLYFLIFFRVSYQDAVSEYYFVPLIGTSAEQPRDAAILRFEKEGKVYSFFNAFQDLTFEKWLFERIEKGETLSTQHGEFRFNRHQPEADIRLLQLSEIRNMKVEQSNTSIAVREKYLLKIYRKWEEGINPEVEMLDFLQKQGYKNVPGLVADVVYEKKGLFPSSLAVMVDLIKSQVDGWGYTLSELKSFFQETEKAKHPEIHLKELLSHLHRLGVLTGKMHRALSDKKDDLAFSPELVRMEDVHKWQEAYKLLFEAVLQIVRKKSRTEKGPLREHYDWFLSQAARIQQGASGMEVFAGKGIYKIRYHGDFHLGQVLRGPHDWILFDFEGEPLRTLSERKSKSCALKDVAGMLRSFSYAVSVSISEIDQTKAFTAKEDLKVQVEGLMRKSFLEGYFAATLKDTGERCLFLSEKIDENHELLSFFEMEKAIYEMNYELNNRPNWIFVPLSGIRRLAQKLDL
ncbi:MAG: hypothetical protein JW893_01070 [Candidatus Omnitrophica bacterium]|nr:hypothetical protein [Candidatus Omnitrophota bacterium]